LCAYLAAKRSWIHVVDESALAVDLNDREPFAIASLELDVAADVDLVELEVDLLPDLLQEPARPLAEMTSLCVVEDDLRDRCRAWSLLRRRAGRPSRRPLAASTHFGSPSGPTSR